MSRAGSAGATVFSFALKTLRCERVFPLRSKRFAVSVWEIFAARHSNCSVLSVNGKKLRRPCLDRFAVFAKASRIWLLRSKRCALSALEFFS